MSFEFSLAVKESEKGRAYKSIISRSITVESTHVSYLIRVTTIHRSSSERYSIRYLDNGIGIGRRMRRSSEDLVHDQRRKREEECGSGVHSINQFLLSTLMCARDLRRQAMT
jgi:hypothetical protein